MPFATSRCNCNPVDFKSNLIQLPTSWPLAPFFFCRVKLSWHCISLQINGFSLATAPATADALATENNKEKKWQVRGGAFENVCGRIGAIQVARECTTKWTRRRAKKKKWERIVCIYVRFGRKSKTWNCMFFNLLNLPSHDFTLSLSFLRFSPALRLQL